MTCCWTLTLTDRRRVGEWSHRPAPSRKAYLGRQAQRPQYLMVALLATHTLLSEGASGGRLRACTAHGHYCTDTLVLANGVTSHPALPKGDPEPHMVLGGLGPSTRNPSQSTQSRPAEPVCIHSQRLTSTYYVPGPTSCSGNSEGNKTHPDPLRSPGGSKPLTR